MSYTSPWERLSEALARVREATKLTQTAAQADICRAIADRAIKVQGKLSRHLTSPMRSPETVLEGAAFRISTDLKPEDLDWAASRPLEPWVVRREVFRPSGPWELEWIELFRSDVTNALCEPEVGGKPSQRTRRKDGTKRRSRPAFDRARRALTALYPGGVPPQAEEPNAILFRRVGDWLKANKLLDVSDDTILRAVGPRN